MGFSAGEGAKAAAEVIGGDTAAGAGAAEIGAGAAAAGGAEVGAGIAEGAGAAELGAGAAEAGAADIGGAVAADAGATMPAAAAEQAGVTAGAAGTSGAAATGTDVLGTIKTLAPFVAAGSNLLAAGASIEQARAAENFKPKINEVPAAPQPQAASDPDVAALRKKNSLLFGADSPLSTDLTKGSADVGNLGRTTLLGGSSKLGG